MTDNVVIIPRMPYPSQPSASIADSQTETPSNAYATNADNIGTVGVYSNTSGYTVDNVTVTPTTSVSTLGADLSGLWTNFKIPILVALAGLLLWYLVLKGRKRGTGSSIFRKSSGRHRRRTKRHVQRLLPQPSQQPDSDND